MNKRSFLLSACLFALATAPAQALNPYKLELPGLESDVRLMQHYFSLNQGFSAAALNKYKQAQGLLKEHHFDEALALALPLHADYPEHFELTLLLTDLWLATEQPEKALLLIDSLEAQLASKGLSQSERLTLADKKSQAYLQQNEPEHALKVFVNAGLDPKQMPRLEQEHYHIVYSELLFENQNYLGSYQQLQQALQLPLLSDRGHIAINQIKPRLAALMHQQAKEAHFTRDYFAAEAAAREAIRLDPNPIHYVHTLNTARQALNRDMQARFQRVLPTIKTAMLNMRYALEVEDYAMLNQEYLRFKNDRETAFILDADHRPYLPQQMYGVIEQVEKNLETQGYRL